MCSIQREKRLKPPQIAQVLCVPLVTVVSIYLCTQTQPLTLAPGDLVPLLDLALVGNMP